jgi:predicted secreted protein
MPANVEQNPSVAAGTVMLSLSLGQVSNRKKLDSDTSAIQTDIDREMLHVSTELYDSKELRACQNYLSRLRLKIKAVSVPSFFRGGISLVKHEALEQIDDLLAEAVEEFRPLVDAFASVSEERKEEARARLGSAFNAGHYPNPEQIRALYSIQWKWFTMDTPDSLKRISRKIYEREVEKAEESIQSAATNINKMLAAEAKKLTDHLIERLSPGEDGKPKTFKQASVANIAEFLKTFRLRNIGTSEDLDKQVRRMEKILEGISPDDLRKNATLREDVSEGFKKVAESLEPMIIDKPRRAINLKDLQEARR